MTDTNTMGRPQPWTPPKAKPHPLLQKVAQKHHDVDITEAFLVAGTSYTLHTLSPSEEAWADSRVEGNNFYQAGRNRRSPYVATALTAIDGVHVVELFQLPDDLDAGARELYTNQPVLDDWRRSQVLQYLNDHVTPEVLMELWNNYLALATRRNEALEKIGPLSSPTPSSESQATSSPVKAVS